jgi:hypothetical protein
MHYMVSQACQSLCFLHSSVILFSLTPQDFILRVAGFKNKLVSELKVAEDNKNWGLFIDSCFTHCQTPYKISWNSPISPRLGDKVRFKSFETITAIAQLLWVFCVFTRTDMFQFSSVVCITDYRRGCWGLVFW